MRVVEGFSVKFLFRIRPRCYHWSRLPVATCVCCYIIQDLRDLDDRVAVDVNRLHPQTVHGEQRKLERVLPLRSGPVSLDGLLDMVAMIIDSLPMFDKLFFNSGL